DSAEILSKIATKVYLIHRNKEFKAFETLINKVKEQTNVEIILDSEVTEITGETLVKQIKIRNIETKEERAIETNGIFIEVGRVAHTDLVADLCKRDDKKQIIVDERCNTSTEGIFAAGDVTTVPFKQISIACGQATIAALASYQYLQLKDGKKVGVIFDRSPFRKKE
ncbi:MAG: NAD(P)/FAD-dependent oxidoreductase, partial [Candidatus Falkowbacteria bacterium]|nr:NAD(P)/FAD-dependent oxidoreductase [Candidatus Falkowbacteria bacterium]